MQNTEQNLRDKRRKADLRSKALNVVLPLVQNILVNKQREITRFHLQLLDFLMKEFLQKKNNTQWLLKGTGLQQKLKINKIRHICSTKQSRKSLHAEK